MNGWIILDKPPGLSSAQAVAAVKRILRTAGRKPAKIGHGGTLDPLATGVLLERSGVAGAGMVAIGLLLAVTALAGFEAGRRGRR